MSSGAYSLADLDDYPKQQGKYAPGDLEESPPAPPKKYLPEVNKAVASVPRPDSPLNYAEPSNDVTGAVTGFFPTRTPKNGPRAQLPAPSAGSMTKAILSSPLGQSESELIPGAGTEVSAAQHLATPGKRWQGATEAVQGVGEAVSPFMGPAAAEMSAAPALVPALKFGAGLGVSMAAQPAAEKVAAKLGASPDQQHFWGELAFWAPQTFGLISSQAGVEGGIESTPEGTRAAVTGFKGKAGAGVAVTPQGFTVRGKVGPFEGSKTFSRGTQAGPAIEPPTIEATPPDPATEALVKSQQIDQAATRAVNGQPPVAPPPPPPSVTDQPGAPPELKQGVISQKLVDSFAGVVSQLPETIRAQAVQEAHAKLTQVITEGSQKGAMVGPDGKLLQAKDPADASKQAMGLINSAIDAHEKASAKTQGEGAGGKGAAAVPAEAAPPKPGRSRQKAAELAKPTGKYSTDDIAESEAALPARETPTVTQKGTEGENVAVAAKEPLTEGVESKANEQGTELASNAADNGIRSRAQTAKSGNLASERNVTGGPAKDVPTGSGAHPQGEGAGGNLSSNGLSSNSSDEQSGSRPLRKGDSAILSRDLEVSGKTLPAGTKVTLQYLDPKGLYARAQAEDGTKFSRGLGAFTRHEANRQETPSVLPANAVAKSAATPEANRSGGVPPATERRSNVAERKRVSEMSHEERGKELLASHVVDLPNRRGFDEAGKSPAVAMSDADGLKALNDKFGYEAGNELLRAKAEALKQAGLEAYHDKGDEFLYRGASPEELHSKLEKAREILRNRTIEVQMTDGSVKRFKGADFSHGNGKDLTSAEAGLKAHKSEREARGERARGELRGITPVGSEESQVSKSPEVEKPTKYKFGNTQAPIHPDSEAAKSLESARARISESDLAGKGRDIGDGGNHVTVRYGIQDDETGGIKKFLSQQLPFEATLGKTDSFPPSEHSDGAAPIIAPVNAPDLHRLNAELERHGKFTEPSFKEYKPHATVGYVKPEVADRYVGMKVTEGKKFPVKEIAITDRNGKQEVVRLEGKPAPRKESPAKKAKPERVEPVVAEEAKPVKEEPESILSGESGEFKPGELVDTALEATGAVGEYLRDAAHFTHIARDLQRDLETLDTRKQALVLNAVKTFQKLKKQGLTKEDDEKLYHFIENPETENLGAKQEDWLDQGTPLLDTNADLYTELTQGGVPIENYVHRVVKGKGGVLDRIAQGVKGIGQKATLSKSAPQTKSRTYMALENQNGERQVVSIKGGQVTGWNNGTSENLGGISHTQEGNVFEDKDGNIWNLKQATTKEIEKNTETKYYHSFFASTLVSNIQLQSAVNAMRFLNEFKASPEFKETAFDLTKGNPPKGWQSTNLMQFKGYAFEPRTAEVLDAYYDRMRQGNLGALDQVGKFMRVAMLLNPIRHPINVAMSWSMERGASGFLMPSRIKNTWTTGNRAIKAVISKNQDYVDGLEAGGALQSHREMMSDIHHLFYDQLSEGLGKEEPWAMKVAKALGIEHGNLLNILHKFSSTVAWVSGDIGMLQSAYQYQVEHPGTKLADAFKEVGRINPEYRVPTRIGDSPMLSKLMKNKWATIFGAYHYSLLRSFGEVAKSALGAQEPAPGRTKAEEVAKGWDRIALLALGIVLMSAVGDELAKKLTHDKHARMLRAGPFGVIDSVASVMKHEQSAGNAIQRVVTPAPQTKAAAELAFDREFYSGHAIYDPHASFATQGEQIGHYLLGETTGQIGQYEKAQTTEQKKRFAWSQVGIQFHKTAAEKTAADIAMSKVGTEAENPEDQANRVMRREILDQLRAGNSKPLRDAEGKREITPKQAKALEHRAHLTPLQDTIHGFTYPEARKVYEVASPEEKKELDPIMRQKRTNLFKAGRGKEATSATP